MARLAAFNFRNWIEEHRDLLKPLAGPLHPGKEPREGWVPVPPRK